MMKITLFIFVLLSLAFATIKGQSYTLYSNGALGSGIENWSWAPNNIAATQRTRGGHSRAWSQTVANYTGIYVHGPFAGNADQVVSLSFWIIGDTAGQSIGVQFFSLAGTSPAALGQQVPLSQLGITISNSWQQVTMSLASFKIPAGSTLGGIVFQALTGASIGTVWYDDITYTTGIYSNGVLAPAFASWSWATHNLKDTTKVRSPHTYAWSMAIGGWKAIYPHGNFITTADKVASLGFFIAGDGKSGQDVGIQFYLANGNSTGNQVLLSALGKTITSSWIYVSAPLSRFNVPSGTIIGGFVLQGQGDTALGTVYFDEIAYYTNPGTVTTTSGATAATSSSSASSSASSSSASSSASSSSASSSSSSSSSSTSGSGTCTLSGLSVCINSNQVGTAVPNTLYGVSFANSTNLLAAKYKLNRWGGNSASRFNWQLDVGNKGQDWYYENIAETVANEAALPNGTSSDRFIKDTLSASAAVILTIPTIGWTAVNRTNKLCSFSVRKYGSQQATDSQWAPDCGNGYKNQYDSAGNPIPITGNNPRDTSKPIDQQFSIDWIKHINQVFGTGKIPYVQLDNEPCLWHSTHRDVHPNPLTYDELWAYTVTYASALKTTFPSIKIAGPMFWGWCAIMYSPKDGCAPGADSAAHGNLPFLQWYINKIADHKNRTGVQLVDYIDIHWYPQGSNVALSSVEDSTTNGVRLRSTRALWDTTYTDESWIGRDTSIKQLYILPRIQGWINAVSRNVSLKISVSEYNWGNDEIITGAIAQVDVLGIFAQYGVSLAMRWVSPVAGSVNENAFKLFNNYDGQGSAITGNLVSATSSNRDSVACYAYGGTGASTLYVILINKNAGSVIPSINTGLTKSASGIKTYGFSSAKKSITAGTTSITSGKFSPTLPGYSATLYVIPK